MESTGLFCVRSTSCHLFTVLTRAGRIKEAEKAMNALWKTYIVLADGSQRELKGGQLERRQPDEKMVTNMANSAVELGRPDIAVSALQKMEKQRVAFTVFTVSVLIKAHGRQRNVEGITNVLNGLVDRGIKPDLVVLNTAIDAYVRCGENGKAGQVLRDISKRGLAPNASSYNPILREIARSGKLEEALSLQEDMKRRNIKPSGYTYNALIQTAVTARQWTLATDFLIASSAAAQKWSRKGSRSRGENYDGSAAAAMSKDVAVGFTTVISGLALNGDVKRAGQLLDYMVKRIEQSGKSAKLEAEIGIAVSAILSALMGQNEVVRAWRLFRSVRKRFSITLPPDTYNAVIRGLARRGEIAYMDAADYVFSEMMEAFNEQRCRENEDDYPLSKDVLGSTRGAEATPQDITLAYNTLIDGHCRCGIASAGERLLEEMEENGHVATVVTYTTLINGYGKETDLVSTRRIFKRMRERGISPDRVTMNAFIGGCVRSGDMELALRLFEEMQRIGSRVSPDLVTFSALIAGYVRQNKRNEAWDMYEEMKGLKIVPNERLLDRMMAAFVSPDLKPGRREVDDEEEYVDEGDMEEVLDLGELAEDELEVGLEGDVLRKEGWTSQRATVLLQDMEVCRCSEVNKKRWRKAISSLWVS